MVDAHEADRQAGRHLSGYSELEEADNTLFFLAGSHQQNIGLLSLDCDLVGGDEWDSTPGQERRTEYSDTGWRHAAARAFASVAASLRRAGRKTAARAYDAMIAAIAIANELPLYTCNPSDFEGIDGLTVVALEPPPPRK